ncbi:MAG: DUF87 domain-containing protein [Treponema sp.]|nr:DUF87 domain-containing protein [Treponema sp.]
MLLDEDAAIEQAVARSIDAAVDGMFDDDGNLIGMEEEQGHVHPAYRSREFQDEDYDEDYIEPYEDMAVDGNDGSMFDSISLDYMLKHVDTNALIQSFMVCEEAPIQDDVPPGFQSESRRLPDSESLAASDLPPESDGLPPESDDLPAGSYPVAEQETEVPQEAVTEYMPSLSPVFDKMEDDAKREVGDAMPLYIQGQGASFDETGELTEEDILDIDEDINIEEEDDRSDEFTTIDDSSFDIVEEESVDVPEPEEALPEHVDALLDEDEGSSAVEQAEEDPVSAMVAMPKPVKTASEAPKPRRAGTPYGVSTDLLNEYDDNPYWIIDDETKMAATNLMATLSEFGIKADVTGIRKGPVVTMFELLPAPGVKLSKIASLQDNIALRLAASSVRIVAPIPGKKAVGIEIPNKSRATVSFRECIEQDLPEWKKFGVPVVLGKNIQGEKVVIDLVKTPHLLIAGSTGSGKSVCVNSMILSILYKRSPDQVKLILIDPKIVELKLYNDIPHLLTPVITDPKRAMQALQYCLCEMERRYSLLDGMGARDISSYNKKIVDRHIAAEKLPYMIVVIDEFADLMATTGKQLESVLARLAAMSRAVGIHLVLATQRPSIDVITGLIKANIPSRIAFMVASKTDSRIIIDQMGAEKLLGKGDMLYASSTDPFPVRIQGTFVSDQEVEDVVSAVKEWGEPEYIDDEIFVPDDDDDEADQMAFCDGNDPLYDRALDIVVQAGKASASYIQRRLKIGYNRAARLVEEMEERGIVGPAQGSKPRELIQIP